MQTTIIPQLDQISEIIVRQGKTPKILNPETEQVRCFYIMQMMKSKEKSVKVGTISKGTRKGQRTFSLELSQGVKYTAYVKPENP